MQEQISKAIADFKLGVLKNFLNSTRKHRPGISFS